MARRVKIEKILEEFLDGIKLNGEYHEIYVNPTPAEMDEVADKVNPKKEFGWDNAWIEHQTTEGSYLRFTALPNKRVFVFSPWLIHEQLKGKFGYEMGDIYVHGIARKVGGRWTAVEAHNIEFMIKSIEDPKNTKYSSYFHGTVPDLKKFAAIDWSWIDKYISFSPLLAKFQPEIKKVLHETI